jgi:SHS2 domain-containing protein
MAYRWVEHTGELEVEIEAASPEDVFGEGLRAVREVLGSEGEGEPQSRRVELRARDRGALLADWLAELAYLAEDGSLVPERLAELELDEEALVATVEGRRGRAPHLVKAATYHRLAFEPVDGGWFARVVLDV